MKLSIGLSTALISLAAAVQQAAEVYILPTTQSASTTNVTPSLARLILLQRLASNGKGPSSREIPDTVAPEEAVALINKYGKAPEELFSNGHDVSPSQLVVMLEGMTEDQMKELGIAIEAQPAFTIANPPSSDAHENLINNDFYNIGVTNEHGCLLDQITNPFEEACWSGKATIAKYDVSKNTHVLGKLKDKMVKLVKLAQSGEMETTLVLLPATPDKTSPKQWSDKPQELRKRQAEMVFSSVDESAKPPAPTSSKGADPTIPRRGIAACYNTLDGCNQATGNCSHQGSCKNKYAMADGSDGKEPCFACHCLSSYKDDDKKGSVIHWAGRDCSKEDISVPFWLFAGFTLALVSILYLAIGMLYSIGEEKLPGVIGAGVSKSK